MLFCLAKEVQTIYIPGARLLIIRFRNEDSYQMLRPIVLAWVSLSEGRCPNHMWPIQHIKVCNIRHLCAFSRGTDQQSCRLHLFSSPLCTLMTIIIIPRNYFDIGGQCSRQWQWNMKVKSTSLLVLTWHSLYYLHSHQNYYQGIMLSYSV